MSNLKISSSNRNSAQFWRNLAAYKGWKAVCAILDKRIAEADIMINTIGADQTRAFTHRDIAIIKKNEALALKELPEKMVEQLTGTGEQPTEEMDPFATISDELLQDGYNDQELEDALGDDDI